MQAIPSMMAHSDMSRRVLDVKTEMKEHHKHVFGKEKKVFEKVPRTISKKDYLWC
jgi:hypothetical protein